MSHITRQYIQDLRQSFHDDLSQDDWYVVLTSAFASAHLAVEAVPLIYEEALSLYAPHNQPEFDKEAIKIQRRIKESLLKGAIIYGIPSALDAIITWIPILRKEYAAEPGRNDSGTLFRKDRESKTMAENEKAAMDHLRIIYQHNLDNIFDRFGQDANDIFRQTIHFGYGWNLSYTDILNFPSTELCLVAALILQNLRMEVLWHLRGALRSGISREVVQNVHQVCLRIAKDADIRTNKVPTLEEVSEHTNELDGKE